MYRRASLIAIVSLAASSAMLSTLCFAGTKVYVGQRSYTRGRSIDAISHHSYDALLEKYVDDQGNVDYTAWNASPGDLKKLDDYLAHLSSADPSAKASPAAQLAFWINAYNAVTLKGILREYPTDSIRNHTAKVFGYNIWHDLLLYVGGHPYSLDTIEHKILRPAGEPRIHFAIVCASRSCPKLRAEAYTAEQLGKQLAENTRGFFANPGNFRYDARNRRMYLSAILDWFAEDFGETKEQRLKSIAPYLPSEAARQAARRGDVEISYLDYDWGLNDAKTAR